MSTPTTSADRPLGPQRALRRAWASAISYFNLAWVRLLVLLIAAIVVRMPALQGERIWDDDFLAKDNPFMKSPALILEVFRHYLFLDSFSVHYRPVQNISYMADYFFWNTDTWGFHLTNVLLHAGSGVLLYLLLRELLASLLLRAAPVRGAGQVRKLPGVSTIAFWVSLLWVVHPVHSAAIDYISGRADSLAFLFACAGWLLFRRAGARRYLRVRGGLYVLSATCGLLALCSREIAMVWFALFFAHLVLVERALSRRVRIAAVVCGIALIAGFIGLRQMAGQRSAAPADTGWSVPIRASLMARALGDYGRLMIFPSNLHMERTVFSPRAYKGQMEWRSEIRTEYLSILGLFVLAVMAVGSSWPGRGRVLRVGGACWFFAGYLPVSNIVHLNATVAEHWLYLPSVGFLIFLAGCAMDLPLRYKKAAVALAFLFATGLSVRSYIRSTDWVTAETFYRRVLAAGGTSARTGINLGQIFMRRGDFAEAERIFRKVVEIAPDYPLAQNNLASALSRQGKAAEAEVLFAKVEKNSVQSRKDYPRTWIGALNLARLRYNAKDYQFAIDVLDRARQDYPEVWELISFESEIVRRTKGPDAALRLVEEFSRANWWHHAANLALGRLYAQKGDVNLADAALRRASLLDIHDTESLRLLALIRIRENKLAEALKTQRRAVSRQPDEPRQYVLLSDILEKMGRSDEARAALAEASRLRSFVQSQLAVN